jgi:uncharacterized protein (TIGR00730 family)
MSAMQHKNKLNVPEKHLPQKPLTKKELHNLAKERVSVISQEFTEGFAFLEKYPRSVTFFGSARFPEDNQYYKQARSIAGKIVNQLGYSILSGGGPGIMEAANRGAFENNGQSLGLTIELPEGQVTNPYINQSIDFFYFFSRKVCLSFSAEAYLFFPGGYGTMDEVYEILTLVQTHKIEKVPIILVGADFWHAIEASMNKEMLSRGTIDENDISLYTITDDEDEIIRIIKEAPVHNGVPLDIPEVVKDRIKNGADTSELSKKNCVPCKEGSEPLHADTRNNLLTEVNQWILVDDTYIEKVLHMKDFAEVMVFVNKVANIAEKEGHHPDIHIFDFNKVRLTLSTHKIKGLTENDFILASKIDELLR